MLLIGCVYIGYIQHSDEVDIKQQLGQNIRAMRLEQGRSQEQFAFDANIHRTYVSGVERGARNPSLTVIEKFAAALGVSLGELLDYHLKT